jgi:hypothetical protein
MRYFFQIFNAVVQFFPNEMWFKMTTFLNAFSLFIKLTNSNFHAYIDACILHKGRSLASVSSFCVAS